MIYSCICYKCGKWHSHCFPDPANKKRFVCVNCLHKVMKDIKLWGEDGRGEKEIN